MKLGKMYTPLTSFHCICFRHRYYNCGGEVRKAPEWVFGPFGYSFTVDYGFKFRQWLRRII